MVCSLLLLVLKLVNLLRREVEGVAQRLVVLGGHQRVVDGDGASSVGHFILGHVSLVHVVSGEEKTAVKCAKFTMQIVWVEILI